MEEYIAKILFLSNKKHYDNLRKNLTKALNSIKSE